MNEILGELEQIKFGLRRMKTDANAGTVSKALSYLHHLSAGPVWYIRDDGERRKTLNRHIRNCKDAIKRGDTYVLRCQIHGWF